MQTSEELATALTQPIEKLDQRAAVGLDRAGRLAALQKRKEEPFLFFKFYVYVPTFGL